VVTHSPLTPVAPVQRTDAALSSLTQGTIFSEPVKCIATSKQWVIVSHFPTFSIEVISMSEPV